jgi:hypothetical protein
MKRLSIALGRIGATLLAICLSLGILLLIPQASIGIPINGAEQLEPMSYSILTPLGPQATLTPETTLKMEFRTNSTLTVYLVNLPTEDIPKNLTSDKLRIFLKDKAGNVLLEKKIAEKETIEYTPAGMVRTTLILLNEESQTASAAWSMEILASIAPKARLAEAIIYLSPVGMVLAGQWIFIEIQERKRKSLS